MRQVSSVCLLGDGTMAAGSDDGAVWLFASDSAEQSVEVQLNSFDLHASGSESTYETAADLSTGAHKVCAQLQPDD